jgi:acyl carrier protein
VGVAGAIKFRRYARVLLNRFFSAPDESAHFSRPVSTTVSTPAIKANPVHAIGPKSKSKAAHSEPAATPPVAVTSEPIPIETVPAPLIANEVGVDMDSTASKAMVLATSEASLDLSGRQDNVRFAELGVDSLMSLVIAEKFGLQLGIVIKGCLFLEYPTLNDLPTWLIQYYS